MKNHKTSFMNYTTALLILFFLFVYKSVSSQNYWKPAGNTFSSIGAAKKMGTLDCNEINYYINNIERIKFTSSCVSAHDNNIQFLNNKYIDFSSTDALYVPGGGTIYSKGSGAPLFMPVQSSTCMKIGIVDSIPDTESNFQVFDQPANLKSLIHAETMSSGNINCYSIFAKAFPKGGYGYGINTEGGRYGILAKGSGTNFSNPAIVVCGLNAKATGTEGFRAGVYAEGAGSLNSTNYGIFATAPILNGGAAGFFAGDLVYTGNLFQGSDKKLKKNISEFTNSLNIINRLSVKEFFYNENYNFMNFPKEKQIGFIAQELEQVLPSLVVEKIHPGLSDETTGAVIHAPVQYKAVNYTGLIPIVVGAVQDQQSQINQLKIENEQLIHRLTLLEKGLSALQGTDPSLFNKFDVIPVQHNNFLLPNRPNPVKNETVLPYCISKEFREAEIRILEAGNANVISHVPIVTGGFGEVRLDCSHLKAGAYSFELFVDKERNDSRTFIIAK